MNVNGLMNKSYVIELNEDNNASDIDNEIAIVPFFVTVDEVAEPDKYTL